jgi:hypothetical protein
MKSAVWFKDEIFDPRQLNRQVYVRSVLADELVTLSRDGEGVHVHLVHEGDEQDIFVPNGNVRQTLNVPFAVKTAKK